MLLQKVLSSAEFGLQFSPPPKKQQWHKLTSFVQLSTKGPPNIAAIQSQLEMSKGLWAMIVPSSSLNTTSAIQRWDTDHA